MLKIFNNLSVFFEDSYREINVREYARLIKVSPPTASTLLKKYENESILKSRKDRLYQFYSANRENSLFIDLSKAYYRIILKSLIEFLANKFNYKTMILFGSLSKGEATKESDIDIFINSIQKEIDIVKFEKVLKRKIQLHFKPELDNEDLKRNIKQGVLLEGEMI